MLVSRIEMRDEPARKFCRKENMTSVAGSAVSITAAVGNPGGVTAVAASPFAEPDYQLPDAEGRLISQVEIEGYVVSYWIDAPAKCIVIVEIERED